MDKHPLRTGAMCVTRRRTFSTSGYWTVCVCDNKLHLGASGKPQRRHEEVGQL